MKIGIWGSQTLTGEATPDEGTVLNKGTIKGESVKPSRMDRKTRWALIILGVYTSYAMYTYFRSPYATTIWPISWTRSIRGVVYDAETKEPLRNIDITVSRSFHIFGPHSKQFIRIIRTDERGQYRVPGKFILNPVGGFTGMTLFVEHTRYDALGRIAVDKDHGWSLDGGDKVSLSRHFRDWVYKYDRDDARDILLTERQDGDFVCDFPMKRKIKGSNETQSK